MIKKGVRYFVQGLLIIVPVAVTGYVVFKIIALIASLFTSFGIIVHPLIDPFIVLVASLLLIIGAGQMGSSLFFRPLFDVLENAIEKAGPVNIIYSSIKDFLSAFVGNKKRFDKPVLIDIDKQNGVQQMGFVTQQSLEHMGIAGKKVSVYIPFSYTFSGRMLILPVENIKPLNIGAAQAMKFVFSGGVTDVDTKEDKPTSVSGNSSAT